MADLRDGSSHVQPVVNGIRPWQDIAREVQQKRDASIAAIRPKVPDVPGDLLLNVTDIPKQLLSRSELEITQHTTEQLVSLLASGKLSSVEVTTAYLRRIGLAHKLTNCVTEVMVDAALARATYLDQYLKTHGRPIGPMHGLPISVKEHISMKDLTASVSFVAWYDNVVDANAHTLQILWNAGAVFYARTTEPLTLMQLETNSNLYGTTVNPYNRNLTSGGSSGGESAALALRGSCLGVGSDIGGSVRVPAANCGIWSFRPSTYRVPLVGTVAAQQGNEQIMPVQGPMATSFEALNLFMKTVIDSKPWLTEPSLLPLPWDFPSQKPRFIKANGKRRLKVGVMWLDDVVRPHPPITRALHIVVEKLKADPERFEVVDWQPFKHDLAWDIICGLFFGDGGKEFRSIIGSSGEPTPPLFEWILSQPNVRNRTIGEIWQLTVQREVYRGQYAAHWNSTAGSNGDQVDVILCPVGPGAAPPLEHSKYWGYTSIWNLLDYPAMVFPVTQVGDIDGGKPPKYDPINAQDAYNWKLWVDGGVKLYKDAPVGLQLVGRRWDDESVFEAMTLIKEATGLH